MSGKQKKKKGCFTWILCLVAIYLIFGSGIISLKSSDNQVPKQADTTVRITNVITSKPATAATKQPATPSTSSPATEPLVIYLKYPELGEYGNYYIFNLFVEKATKEDMNTVIQCFVPAGTYTVTNIGKYPTFVYGYSKDTQITSAGWEEPVDGWVSKMLQVGDSCEVTVEEDYYIKLQQNDTFKLVQKSAN